MSHDTNDADDSETHEQTSETETRPATVRHEWDQSEHPGVTLVEAVAAATGRTTADLPPLRESVDPDALEAILSREKASSVAISFQYAGTTVQVKGDGTIKIQVDGGHTDGSE